MRKQTHSPEARRQPSVIYTVLTSYWLPGPTLVQRGWDHGDHPRASTTVNGPNRIEDPFVLLLMHEFIWEMRPTVLPDVAP